MDSIRQYLLSVTAAALICAIARQLTGSKGSAGTVIRIIAGIFLTVTVISPLAEFSVDGWSDYIRDLQTDAGDAVAEGERILSDNLNEVIKQRTEAYILDKANMLDAEVTVEVTNRSGTLPVPERIVIHGRLSPYAKKRLEELIVQDLGVAKECLEWTG